MSLRVPAGAVSTLPNKLLAALPQAEWDVLRHDLQRNYVCRGEQLLAHDCAPEHAYFVEDGLVSVLADANSKTVGPDYKVGVAMVGHEGLVDGLGLLGDMRMPISAAMQFPGTVLSIPASVLTTRFEKMPGLRRTYLSFVQSFVAQVTEAYAGIARYTLLQRCVRWLLMADERTGGTDLPITQEGLASLLGVRRPGVTLAMILLRKEGLIQVRRGNVLLLDRPRLRAFADLPSAHPAPIVPAERSNSLSPSAQ